MRAKFKKTETAIQRRDEAIKRIFRDVNFLMRLSDNHPDVMPLETGPHLRGMAQTILFGIQRILPTEE